jgi:KDO2-lipid IV(A) lauroyltransferase
MAVTAARDGAVLEPALSGPAEGRARWHAHGLNRTAAYRLAAVAAAGLPRPVRLRAAAAIGGVAARWLPAERAAVSAAMARIAPGRDRRAHAALVAEVFRQFAMCFADLVAANRRAGAPERLLARVAGGEHLARATAGGRGAVVVTAHVGNWELGGRLLATHLGRPTHVVVHADPDPGVERFLREGPGPVRFARPDDPRFGLPLVGALRRGEIVALQGDRALGNRGDEPVAFFGGPARLPLGPFVLARAARVPVLATFCLRRPDHRYAITVSEPIDVGADAAAGLCRWVSVLEDTVRRHPAQWFNFFDVWSPSGGR